MVWSWMFALPWAALWVWTVVLLLGTFAVLKIRRLSASPRPMVLPWIGLGVVIGASLCLAVGRTVPLPPDLHVEVHNTVSSPCVAVELNAPVPIVVAPVAAEPVAARPIDEAALRELVLELRADFFDASRLSLLRAEAPRWFFRPEQAARVLIAFDMPDAKLGALEALKPQLYEAQDLSPILGQFREPFGERDHARLILGR